MNTPISRQALEQVYHNFFQPFFDDLTTVFKKFDGMFRYVHYPQYDIGLLNQLDSQLYFELQEFSFKSTLSFELAVDIAFNQYDYKLNMQLMPSEWDEQLKWDYNTIPTKEQQVEWSNAIAQTIVGTIKSKFPDVDDKIKRRICQRIQEILCAIK